MLKLYVRETFMKLRKGHTIVKFQSSYIANFVTTSNALFQRSQPQPDLNCQEKAVVNKLFSGLVASDRACLSQAITLIESTHPRKRLQAKLLLNNALHLCKKQHEENKMHAVSFRIGKLY